MYKKKKKKHTKICDLTHPLTSEYFSDFCIFFNLTRRLSVVREQIPILTQSWRNLSAKHTNNQTHYFTFAKTFQRIGEAKVSQANFASVSRRVHIRSRVHVFVFLRFLPNSRAYTGIHYILPWDHFPVRVG